MQDYKTIRSVAEIDAYIGDAPVIAFDFQQFTQQSDNIQTARLIIANVYAGNDNFTDFFLCP